MGRTGDHNYFEDFTEGDVIEHRRGKTVSEVDNVLLTNLVMNTAEAHFNEDSMLETEFGERIVFGGINLAIVNGLASPDITENAIRELSYDDVRFTNPVYHGDTLYAESEVLEKRPSDHREDAGIVTFRVRGHNQDGDQVLEAAKTVLVKRRPAGGG